MNRRKTDIDMNNLKLYIARDEGKWDGSRNMIYTQEQNTLIWQSPEQARANTIDNL